MDIAITGPTGSGKGTILKAISKMLIKEGCVVADGPTEYSITVCPTKALLQSIARPV